MMFSLTGKTAFVTGGASGIGLAVAKLLAHGSPKPAQKCCRFRPMSPSRWILITL